MEAVSLNQSLNHHEGLISG